MTMFVLIVEDEEAFIAELRQIFDELPGRKNIKVARSRNAASDLLASDFFDLIVLDLKIPTIDGALDANPQHGHAVFARAQSVTPGTPVFVLTGSPAEDFIPAMLRQQQQVDVWSEGRKVGTIGFLQKSKLDECPAMLEPIATAVNLLSDVELDRGGVSLTLQDDRLIRIFAKKCGGTRCQISRVGGGLSSAKVVRVRVTDSGGARIHDAVAKLGSLDDVRDEGDRYDNFVMRLDPRATPRKLATLEFGAGAMAGIFYGLAEGFEASTFDVARYQDGQSAKAIKSIEAVTKRWTDGVSETRRPIRCVRQRVLSDDGLREDNRRISNQLGDGFRS